ncbi:hydrogenase large subunit [Alicyclobacillus mengziensis]|uniref:NADH-quinone oxidoreductase subunit C n=1 Tax=Alicyclobacillus mengziensis TaxID=2931921 RepID=A0A9X7W094_9BACL|nr:NADH-quinone oxidoreductase subunit C [Alicyclobacillus mengziensis]QSO47802.1 NADH-quinone oxidoreductase subunit C [Alicyclobacillus mengziensis]
MNHPNLTTSFDTDDDWIHVNVEHKTVGHQLLALTGYRSHRIKVHWLKADGTISDEGITTTEGRFPSLSRALPEVNWDEREIYDLFGYEPSSHPDLRPLIRTPRWPDKFFPMQEVPVVKDLQKPFHPEWRKTEPDNPARTVEGEGVTIMKVGPTHAGIIESGHFVFSIMGENVLYLDAHLFQNHRGIEKVLEGLTVQNALPVVSRICGADTVSHQVNFVTAVEQLGLRKVPEELSLQRILLLESERILSHLNDLAQIPAGVGFQVAHQRGLAIKEAWQRGLATVFGHRFLFDAVRFCPVPNLDLHRLRSLVLELERHFVEWRQFVDAHHGFHDRMQGVGIVKRSDAQRLGAVGVAMRATGAAVDVRTVMPLYQGISIEPARAEGGDVEARFQVRIEEVQSSIHIIRTILKQLTDKVEMTAWSPPLDLSGEVVTYAESPHGLNAHVIQLEHGIITRYHVRSGAFRNWPALATAVAGNAVADFPLINKSFELCYSCVDR